MPNLELALEGPALGIASLSLLGGHPVGRVVHRAEGKWATFEHAGDGSHEIPLKRRWHVDV